MQVVKEITICKPVIEIEYKKGFLFFVRDFTILESNERIEDLTGKIVNFERNKRELEVNYFRCANRIKKVEIKSKDGVLYMDLLYEPPQTVSPYSDYHVNGSITKRLFFNSDREEEYSGLVNIIKSN